MVCTHERAADGGNREPARRGTRLGRETVRRPELHRLAERPRGRPGQVGGRSARSDPPAAQTASLAAIRFLEQAVLDAPLEGAVLRYGGLYSPGASEGLVELVRARKLPIVGAGSGVWSWIHVDDAAAATLAALERGRGIYNIVDDEPAPVSDWLPYLAEQVGAKPPMRLPTGSAASPPARSRSR